MVLLLIGGALHILDVQAVQVKVVDLVIVITDFDLGFYAACNLLGDLVILQDQRNPLLLQLLGLQERL